MHFGVLGSNVVRESHLIFKAIEKKVFKEEKMTQVELYDIDKSTTLECNKRHMGFDHRIGHFRPLKIIGRVH